MRGGGKGGGAEGQARKAKRDHSDCLHLLFGFVFSLVKRATVSSFGLGSYRGKVDFVLVLKLLIKVVRCNN